MLRHRAPDRAHLFAGRLVRQRGDRAHRRRGRRSLRRAGRPPVRDRSQRSAFRRGAGADVPCRGPRVRRRGGSRAVATAGLRQRRLLARMLRCCTRALPPLGGARSRGPRHSHAPQVRVPLRPGHTRTGPAAVAPSEPRRPSAAAQPRCLGIGVRPGPGGAGSVPPGHERKATYAPGAASWRRLFMKRSFAASGRRLLRGAHKIFAASGRRLFITRSFAASRPRFFSKKSFAGCGRRLFSFFSKKSFPASRAAARHFAVTPEKGRGAPRCRGKWLTTQRSISCADAAFTSLWIKMWINEGSLVKN